MHNPVAGGTFGPMSTSADRRGRERQAIVGAIVCCSLVLQMLLVPLHLAQNEHVDPGSRGAHFHSADGFTVDLDGHRHDLGFEASDTPDSGHEPHSEADHESRLARPGASLSLTLTAQAPATPGVEPSAGRSPACTSPVGDETVPRAPPLRTAAAPRAPPIAS